ncbi:hypothetical protein ABW19_dt0206817 [Dactylella cylindrospora]|nr:hypothetical protein ABW19_dt0206817 [Dactylella cylindrospora]
MLAQIPTSTPEPAEKLYFAYGSNLSFEQMAKRCPQSRFIGRARLHQYKFQINERGYANVLNVKHHDPQAFVDGLCYLLTEQDEARLDRAEGVPTAYIKKMLDAEFFPGPVNLLGRTVTNIVRRSELPSSDLPLEPQGQQKGEMTQVMVYLSVEYIQSDRPWDEYIHRMKLGLQEALRLGISPAYVENDVLPLLKIGKGVRNSKNSIFSSSQRNKG